MDASQKKMSGGLEQQKEKNTASGRGAQQVQQQQQVAAASGPVLPPHPTDAMKTMSVVLPCAGEGEFAMKTVRSVFDSFPDEDRHMLEEIVVVD